MKQKLVLFFLCAAFFAAISCSKEVYDEDILTSASSLNISRIKLKEFQDNKLAFEKYESFQESKELKKNSRIIEDTIYNFTIDTDEGVYIEKGDYNSYTFPVHKSDGVSGSKIENILFTANGSGDYDAYIVKYDFTAEELKTLTTAELNTKEVLYTPIGVEGKYTMCVFMYSEDCSAHPGCDCGCVMVLEASICASDGGAGNWPGADNMPSYSPPSTPNTGNNPGQHGGGGGVPGTGNGYNPNLPVITTPIFDGSEAPNPCE